MFVLPLKEKGFIPIQQTHLCLKVTVCNFFQVLFSNTYAPKHILTWKGASVTQCEAHPSSESEKFSYFSFLQYRPSFLYLNRLSY